MLCLLDSADKRHHPRVAPLIEPTVGLGLLGLGQLGMRTAAPTLGDRSREVFDAEGDLVAEVGFGADVGEVVRHVEKVGQRVFAVHNFLHSSQRKPLLLMKLRPLLDRFGGR